MEHTLQELTKPKRQFEITKQKRRSL